MLFKRKNCHSRSVKGTHHRDGTNLFRIKLGFHFDELGFLSLSKGWNETTYTSKFIPKLKGTVCHSSKKCNFAWVLAYWVSLLNFTQNPISIYLVIRRGVLFEIQLREALRQNPLAKLLFYENFKLNSLVWRYFFIFISLL